MGCGDNAKSAGSVQSDIDLMRRYRDEILAISNEGLAISDLYDAMGYGLISAYLSNPNLGGDFAATRNSWFPALINLLDGDGLMPVSSQMQSDLTALLDNLVAAADTELASQLADLRSAADLDALTGKTVSMANAQFTAGGATPVEGTSWGSLKAQFR